MSASSLRGSLWTLWLQQTGLCNSPIRDIDLSLWSISSASPPEGSECGRGRGCQCFRVRVKWTGDALKRSGKFCHSCETYQCTILASVSGLYRDINKLNTNARARLTGLGARISTVTRAAVRIFVYLKILQLKFEKQYFEDNWMLIMTYCQCHSWCPARKCKRQVLCLLWKDWWNVYVCREVCRRMSGH